MTERVALVTGASSGIGEETARLLHEAGFTTYAVARRVDRMAGLEKAGVHTFAMDVTDDASMVAGINRIVVDKGRIDVLVNNAGYGSYGAVEDVPAAFVECVAWMRVFAGQADRARDRGWPVHELETGHEAMVTAPKALAEVLIELATR